MKCDSPPNLVMSTKSPPKPRIPSIRSDITRLPSQTTFRKLLRLSLKYFARLMLWLFAEVKVLGLENIPLQGSLLVVINHLGDADAPLVIAATPLDIDWFAKAELYEFPILGRIIDAYGVIWVHRGQPDRTALRAAVDGLSAGRSIGIAPEGRESPTGALEEGTHGAAYLALKTNAPILPVTFTGTDNASVYGNLLHFRRSKFSITYGPTFTLDGSKHGRDKIQQGTNTIMERLAAHLPAGYRGVYQNTIERSNDCEKPK